MNHLDAFLEWETQPLDKIAEIHDSGRQPIKASERTPGSTPYCGANGIIDHVDGFTHSGDFVMLAEDGGFFDPGGHSSYLMSGKFWANNHVHILRGKEGRLLNQFLHYFLNYADLRPYLTGATRPKLTQTAMKRVSVAVPYPDDPARSLAEQRRIVARMEALFAELRECRRLHEAVVEDTGRLMDAVLGEVFKDISSRYATKRLKLMTSKIGSGSTPRGGKSVYSSAGIPFIRSLNVRWNEFSTKDLAFIDGSIHERMKSTEVKPGDVLLNITGASIGRACNVPDNLCPANVNQHVSIIRPMDELSPRYLMYWLTAPRTQIFINSSQSGATRQALTKNQIENFEVPFPNRPSQDQVVAQLDAIRAEISAMQVTQLDDKNLLSDMEQAILAQAFRGEL